MTFLLEYKESACFALELAKREVTHLAYTHHKQRWEFSLLIQLADTPSLTNNAIKLS